MMSHQQLQSIIGVVNDAVLDDSLWTGAMRCICDGFMSSGMLIHSVDRQTGKNLFSLSYGLPECFVEEYNKDIYKIDPRIQFASNHPNTSVTYDHLHTTETEIDRNEYYAWLARIAGFRYYLSARLCHSETWSMYATVHRTKSGGHFDTATIEQFTQLFPHLSQAVKFNQRLADLKMRAFIGADALDHLPIGVLYLSEYQGV